MFPCLGIAGAATGDAVQINTFGLTLDDIRTQGTSAIVYFNYAASGNCYSTRGSVTTDQGPWVYPAGLADDGYEIKVSNTSGTFTSGTVNSWLALGASDNIWRVTRPAPGSTIVSYSVSIRDSGGTVLATDTGTLTATVESNL